MNGKDIISKLKADGWKLGRINGSHHIMVKDGVAVPVPVHGSRMQGRAWSPPSPVKPA